MVRSLSRSLWFWPWLWFCIWIFYTTPTVSWPWTKFVPLPLIQQNTQWNHDAINRVDVFYGANCTGNVFPGATRPFGMVKLGVDVINHQWGNSYSGYAPGGVITGLSMMHESGTGGAPQYGVVAQLPFTSEFNPEIEMNLTRSQSDTGKVGYYAVNTTEGVDIELAAGERFGILKYNFEKGVDAKVLVNVSHHLTAQERPWWTQRFVKGIIEGTESGYGGYVTLKGGWGNQDPWTLYFCGNFSVPAIQVTRYKGNAVQPGYYSVGSSRRGDSFGLVFDFGGEVSEVVSHVGISFISREQACSNINHEQDFNSLVLETQRIWNEEVFDKFEVVSSDPRVVDQFYTNLYGAHLIPSNRTGENPNPGWKPDQVYYDDFFTIWDTFRCLNPLHNIVSRKRGSEIVQALTNIYLNEGWTPDGRSANQNGRTQGGSNSDIVMADAFVKHIPDVDWEQAYAAMKQNAEVQPPYWYDSFAPDASTKQGRGALPDWLQYGYITRNYTRSVSRTMEYAYDDFALSQVAKGLGLSDDHAKYLRRSSQWQNIWNKDAQADGYDYKGFIQPRDADGSFNYEDYDPMSCGGCYWGNDEYEGKPVEYGFAVPHDIAKLIQLVGSSETFAKRIDDLYPLHGKKIADVGNEPSFLTPFLYNFVNEQWKSVELVRYIMQHDFHFGVKSLPGNSDGGAMQAWVIFSLIGIYPIAGTTTYLIASPFVNHLKLHLENGAVFEVSASGLSSDNIYVQSLKINGEKWNKNWVDHDTLFGPNGGSMEFVLGSSQVVWETGPPPPSFGHLD